MAKQILITHEKGGAGCTTTVVNLALELAQADWRVLIVDCDSRGDVATSLGLDPAPALGAHLMDRYIGRPGVGEDVVRFGRAGLDVVPTTASGLRTALQVLDGAGEGAARAWLHELGDGYDFVIYDAKAASGELRRVLMQLADLMVVPTRVEALGLPDIALLIHQYRAEGGTAIVVLPSMVRRTSVHAYNLGVLVERFGELVPVGVNVVQAVTTAPAAAWLEAGAVMVPDRVVVMEASNAALGLREYAQDDPAALAFAKLAAMVTERCGLVEERAHDAQRV